MSDGEQQKGQVGEARRLAAKERLGNLTVVVDWNRVQISGHTSEVMPVALPADWAADGWRVIECDGHDLAALHAAIADAAADDLPTVVLAHTVIGKGVSFMEDIAEFHGRGLTAEEYPRAMAELGLDPGLLDAAREARGSACTVTPLDHRTPARAARAGDADRVRRREGDRQPQRVGRRSRLARRGEPRRRRWRSSTAISRSR